MKSPESAQQMGPLPHLQRGNEIPDYSRRFTSGYFLVRRFAAKRTLKKSSGHTQVIRIFGFDLSIHRSPRRKRRGYTGEPIVYLLVATYLQNQSRRKKTGIRVFCGGIINRGSQAHF
ncbi:MAG: hypothetical protein HKN25_05610 [Pyrinomonadaceae bacterium]|nr:hypothetical protein [Pyrinomonadaceae bacterium]